MKKKTFEIQRWMWLVGVPSLIGVVILFSRTVVTFADMPKRVDNIEQYVVAQQRANEINEKANELLQQQIQQQKQPYCEWYEQKYWCWDEGSQTWYQPEAK
ncbi:MAG: hypothetical protein UX65_C0010G0016 [Parcubacteria group bacterium GW2011_GWB1_46_8]|nr:MAG: hypothetical protein UX65_C0010G0016 [Parcubacteria group bacterium GW2011_GWB1_46_8]